MCIVVSWRFILELALHAFFGAESYCYKSFFLFGKFYSGLERKSW